MTTKADDLDPMQETVNAASRLARSVAGDDDASFMRTFQAVLNTAQTAMAGATNSRPPAVAAPRQDGARPRPGLGRRARRAGSRRTASTRIRCSSRMPGHCSRTVGGRRGRPSHGIRRLRGRRVGGAVVLHGHADRPECRGDGGPLRPGWLRRPDLVGTDVDDPKRGHVVKVRERHTHPGYRPPRDQDDVAVLVLDRSVDDVTPRAIATAAALRSARSVRVVGYGYTARVGRPVTGCAASSTCHSPRLTSASAAIRGPSSWPVPRSSTRTAATGTAVGLPTSTSAVHGCSREPPRGRRRAPFGPVATGGSTPPSTRIASGWRR